MNPDTLNLVEQQNTDFLRAFQKQDENGDPIDITDSTFQMMVKDCEGVEVFDWNTTNSKILITDAANGWIRFNVPAADLLAVDADLYNQDLIETTVGGSLVGWFRGQFNLIKAITI